VIAPCRGNDRSILHLKTMGDLGQIIPIAWNIRDMNNIRELVKHSNVVINLIGSRYDTRNYTLEDVHVKAAEMISQAAKEAKIDRLVHVSALGVDKNSPSRWSKTKALGEEAVLQTFGSDAIIIRPSIMFGSEDYFLRYCASMMRFWPVYVNFNGSKKIQPIWVDNVAEAIVNSLGTSYAKGQIYELAGPKVYTMTEVAEWLRVILRHEKRIVNINEELSTDIVKVLQMHRNPRITLEEFKDKVDKVMTGKYPTLTDLGVLPSHMEKEGFPCIQHFRKPVRFDELLPEDKEAIERDEKIFLRKSAPY